MKKLFKLLIMCLFLFPVSSLKAVDSDSVSYNLKSLYINVDIKNNGDAFVRELITLDGTFNGYERDIEIGEFKNNFTGSKDDFDVNAIYRSTKIANIKVGLIQDGANPNFNSIFKTPIYFKSSSAKNGDKRVYTKSNITGGIRLRMYNETKNSVTSFYIEYTLKDVVVKHSDIAEIYYTFVGREFDDNIDDVIVKINLPSSSNEFTMFAHGPLYFNLDNKNNKEATFSTKNLKSNTGMNVRLLFDKELVLVREDKETNAVAKDKILKIENEYTKKLEAKRARIILMRSILEYVSYIYFAILLFVYTFFYLRYDREYVSSFKGKYNREIIDTYPVATVEYIMNKSVSENAFNATILYLIYKNKIYIEKIEGKKDDDYLFTLMDTEDLSSNEMKVISMLFSKKGEKEVTLSEIKKNAKETSKTGVNDFLNNYLLWQKDAIKDSEYYEFYEESHVPIIISSILLVIGIALMVLLIVYDAFYWVVIPNIILVIILFIYSLVLKKRSKSGIEDFQKWKAFKRFLNDFGKFEDKELPEIKLWDLYFVYATVLGVAKKVSKEMKLKFETYGTAYTGDMADVYFRYMIFNEINSSMNRSFTSARTEVAKHTSSSSGGFGSGFGGGGGGGGRGF